jgi:hypothetical protein
MSGPASDSQVKLFGVYVWMIAASRMRVASAVRRAIRGWWSSSDCVTVAVADLAQLLVADPPAAELA